MLYKLLRPILFLFDPECVHNILIYLLSLVPVRWILSLLYYYENPALEKTLLGITFKNPVGLAAGFDKNAKALLAWQALGFGFIEVGTVTPRPQFGNPKPRLFRLQKEKALVNCMGFNNDGVERVLERIQKAKPGLHIPVGLNIGKNKETPLEQAADDYVFCIKKANLYVDFFVVNISSPNTPELRRLQEPSYFKHLLECIKHVSQKPLFIKISPDIAQKDLEDMIHIAQELNIAGFVATNTMVVAQGGMSGAPLEEKSTALLKRLKELSKDLVLIGVGGIFSEHDALRKFNAGADLIELYTGFIFQGPSLISRIHR